MLSFPLASLHTCIVWSLSSACSHTCTACLSLLLLLFPFACFTSALHGFYDVLFHFVSYTVLRVCFVSCTILRACFVSCTVSRACFVSCTVSCACFVSCIVLRAGFVFDTVLHADLVSCTILRIDLVSCTVLCVDFRFSHRFACLMLFSLACRSCCLVLSMFCFITCICI